MMTETFQMTGQRPGGAAMTATFAMGVLTLTGLSFDLARTVALGALGGQADAELRGEVRTRIEKTPPGDAAGPSDASTAPATPEAKAGETPPPAATSGRGKGKKATPAAEASKPAETKPAEAKAAPATETKLAMPPERVEELKKTWGSGPGLLPAGDKAKLIKAAVAAGIMEEPANGADVNATFYALGNAVPAGWFAEQFFKKDAAASAKAAAKTAAAPAAKTAKPAAKAAPVEDEDDEDADADAGDDEDEEPQVQTRSRGAAPAKANGVNGAAKHVNGSKDPAGLTANGHGDPDEDPIEHPVGDLPDGLDVDVLAGKSKFRDIVVYLVEQVGVRTQTELADICTQLKDSSPVLSRMGDFGKRIENVLTAIEMELPV